MAKVRNLSDIQQEIAFTEFDLYQRYVETLKTSELGRIKSLLPLREMAISFRLLVEKPKNIREMLREVVCLDHIMNDFGGEDILDDERIVTD